MREGCIEFLKILKKNEIPLIILSSAGIGNMVTEFLKEQDLLYPNIHFIGNTLEFDRSGKFSGIKDNKIIHVLNKHEAEIKTLPIYKELLKRKNIIVLGDSLEDLEAVKGFPYKNLITIGFLNYEESLEEAKKNFDIIILNDGSFETVNKILNQILK